MLQHFKHLYSDTIRTEAMRRFGLTAVSLDILPDASHSYVYECKRDGKSYILKITHTIHRRPNHILGELEFINFLGRRRRNRSPRRAVPLRQPGRIHSC